MRSLIGKQAPKFDATAVINGHEIVQDFSLDQYKGKKVCSILLLSDGLYFCMPHRTARISGKARRV